MTMAVGFHSSIHAHAPEVRTSTVALATGHRSTLRAIADMPPPAPTSADQPASYAK